MASKKLLILVFLSLFLISLVNAVSSDFLIEEDIGNLHYFYSDTLLDNCEAMELQGLEDAHTCDSYRAVYNATEGLKISEVMVEVRNENIVDKQDILDSISRKYISDGDMNLGIVNVNGNVVYYLRNTDADGLKNEVILWVSENKVILVALVGIDSEVLVNQNDLFDGLLDAYLTKYPSSLEEGICFDSDGGENYLLEGYLVDEGHNANYYDTCTDLETTDASQGFTPTNEGTILQEYYCGIDNYQYEYHECPGGCLNGACKLQCNRIGMIKDYQYCDYDGYFKDMKDDGEDCANDYECRNYSCTVGVCQSKYVSVRLEIDKKALGALPVNESKPDNTIIDDLFDFVMGVECDPEDQFYFCKGDESFLCGVEGVWESKGQIPGVCGYEEPVYNPPVADNGGSTDSTRGGSPSNNNNDGSSSSSSTSTSTTTTSTTEESFYFYGQDTETPDSEEVLVSELDGNICGDGTCGTIESSYSCGMDCPATERGVVVYYISLVVLVLAIGGVGFLLYIRFFRTPKKLFYKWN